MKLNTINPKLKAGKCVPVRSQYSGIFTGMLYKFFVRNLILQHIFLLQYLRWTAVPSHAECNMCDDSLIFSGKEYTYEHWWTLLMNTVHVSWMTNLTIWAYRLLKSSIFTDSGRLQWSEEPQWLLFRWAKYFFDNPRFNSNSWNTFVLFKKYYYWFKCWCSFTINVSFYRPLLHFRQHSY